MKRRDLLIRILGVSAAWPTVTLLAQPSVIERAAVVIGVDKVGTLPKLGAAASGATEVGQWLRAEGFEVKTLVDDKNPVAIGQVKTVIRELVERGTLQQLSLVTDMPFRRCVDVVEFCPGDGRRVTGEQRLLTQAGNRIRDVRQGPDGWLYIVTDGNEGQIMRLER